MSEHSTTSKQDNLWRSFEESSSSEEWTFVDGKESKSNSLVDEKMESKEAEDGENTINEKTDTNLGTKVKSGKSSLQREPPIDEIKRDVDEAEEASEEKENDSDDVSVLSESEPEQDRRIEKLELTEIQNNNKEVKTLDPKVNTNTSPCNLNLNLAYLFVFTLIITLGMIGLLEKVKENNKKDSLHQEYFESIEKMKKLDELKKNLQDLYDVQHILESIQTKIPEIKKVADQLSGNSENFVTSKTIDLEDTLDQVTYDNKPQQLATVYQGFCSISNKIGSIIGNTENKSCEIPKMLREMVGFKYLYSSAKIHELLDKKNEATSFAKTLYEDNEKIEFMTHFLLREFLNMYSKFSKKVEEEVNKLNIAYTPDTNERSPDNEYVDNKYETYREVNSKSKGEGKYDNDWKRNKYEKKEKHSHEEKKDNKREKYEKNKKNYKKFENDKKNNDDDHQSYKKRHNEYYDRKNLNFDYKYKKDKKEYDDNKHEHTHKKYCDSDYECRKNKNYNDDDDDDDFKYKTFLENNAHSGEGGDRNKYSEKKEKKFSKSDEMDKEYDDLTDTLERRRRKRTDSASLKGCGKKCWKRQRKASSPTYGYPASRYV